MCLFLGFLGCILQLAKTLHLVQAEGSILTLMGVRWSALKLIYFLLMVERGTSTWALFWWMTSIILVTTITALLLVIDDDIPYVMI